jgi:hypothetical protein
MPYQQNVMSCTDDSQVKQRRVGIMSIVAQVHPTAMNPNAIDAAAAILQNACGRGRRRAAFVPRCWDGGAAGRAQVPGLCRSADSYPDGRGGKYRRARWLAPHPCRGHSYQTGRAGGLLYAATSLARSSAAGIANGLL